MIPTPYKNNVQDAPFPLVLERRFKISSRFSGALHRRSGHVMSGHSSSGHVFPVVQVVPESCWPDRTWWTGAGACRRREHSLRFTPDSLGTFLNHPAPCTQITPIIKRENDGERCPRDLRVTTISLFYFIDSLQPWFLKPLFLARF